MIVAVFFMVLGLACSVIPSMPGPLILWLGMLIWTWADGFQRVGWPVLLALLVVAVVAVTADFLITLYMSRRAGASWKAIAGGIGGGLLGGLLLSGTPPVLGSIVGAIAGVVLGMWLVEYWDKRDGQASWRAVAGYLTSVALSAAVVLSMALFMVAVFVWRILA
jgi:uncharacterized protein YqgC (DUF456 family)